MTRVRKEKQTKMTTAHLPTDESIEAEYGDKTIRLLVGFNAQFEKGRIIPKHAKDQGWIWIVRNEAHGLKSSRESLLSSPSTTAF
jgi:hypothetical protein